MPMPEPKDGESEEEFFGRCMGDDLMNEDYPDEKQRYAVCQSLWDKEEKQMETEAEFREIEERFAGSPKNKYGTHSSKGFKGDYEAAWRCHFSQVGGGKTDAESSGPIRGTVRRVSMIAAGMKPACELISTDSIGPRQGPKSPLKCSFPDSPSDYGLSTWAEPKDDDLTQEDITLSCKDLNIIKKTALAEIKRRAKDREEEEEGEGKKKVQETYQCECLECGYRFESEEHCSDVKCPECGGKCRRVERPGPGQKSNKHEVERRTFDLTEMRVSRADGETPKITGHASVFNKLSENLGGFREKVAPGAFSKTIEESDIRALWNHNPDYVLGRNKSGTLALAEDKKGLAIEIEPPDAQWAKDLMETIKRGDVDQMSFSFVTIKDRWENKEGKDSIRTLEEVELFDVSPVTFPAYPQTDVNVRSVFAEAGLNYDALTGVLVRAQKGIPLTDADRDLLKASVDVLKGYLPEEGSEPGGQGSQGVTGDAGRVAILRRRLELVAYN